MVKQRLVTTIAKKEIRSITSEKTIILAILLQLFIAMFSSFLMVGLSAMYDPSVYGRVTGVQYGVGFIGNDTILFDLFSREPSFIPYQMDAATALGALKERKLAAVLWTSESPPEAEDPVTVTLYTISNDIQSTVIEVKIKDILLEYEEILRDIRKDRLDFEPIQVSVSRPVAQNSFYEFIYGLLIPMLLFMPAIISAGLVIDLITEEYQQQTLDTLRTTSATLEDIVCGKILACIAIIPVQVILWLILLSINGIRIAALVEILLHVVFASAALILIAATIAVFYRDRTKAQFIFSTAVIIVLLLILAFPSNPINLIVLLAVGVAPLYHWAVMAASIAGCLILIVLVRNMIRRVEYS
ncbi:ABC transporter permease [Methanospirillum sp. J.3.6.1-F.2.7.3]|uniref:ABC transporter permease n=1 Tax=Methanospirillum purgamenti TaxID=2834276 RepID=A0A8E7B423_9EURY|nr:ABC transporter permease [Methanomicrobiales archaeon]QVV90579.1 ABC transporter permease [Methanospirillum sp. J.3.6.1-F.2.7.3]